MRTAIALPLAACLCARAAADPLARLRAGHPRLLLTDGDLALDAAKADPLRAALHARIVEAAAADLPAPPTPREGPDTGPRLLSLDIPPGITPLETWR